MSRSLNFAPLEYYHLYNRGTEKRNIFVDDNDKLRFLVLLHIANSSDSLHISNTKYQGRALIKLFEEEVKDRLVDIGAYCLMPNHFHLLVREFQDGGLSIFMHKLLTAYTMYFNKKYERSGALFQGKFKASHADNDDYLRYLFAYIHLNPIKLIKPDWKEKGTGNLKTAHRYLNNYHYSSFLDYTSKGDRLEKVILNQSVFPEYFDTIDEHGKEVVDWLDYEKNIKVEP